VFDALNTKQWQTVLLAMEKRYCTAGEVVVHQVRMSEARQDVQCNTCFGTFQQRHFSTKVPFHSWLQFAWNFPHIFLIYMG